MQIFPEISIAKKLTLLALLLGFQSCAYYNTFYNAEQYFAEAQKLTRENQTEKVSREEINLYSKAIEKSKKLLTKYRDSKYRDDAQFIIAKSYYFKGDYLLSKRYFEDLSLNYANSPHAKEVPLWIGRCLMKTGDLEMARYEASRILRGGSDRGLQADALLLMGEIAVQQDSLGLAEDYLEQVIDKSPDGFTKAQAQFQVGRMRENKSDYEGALDAYERVTKYRPSESLKVEAIIRQTSMLKALNRDEDAVEMIQDMLLSDKFVDIRGQLEVELGKLYLVMEELDRAESKFTTIIEDYNRKDVAAEASYYLGELYLTEKLDYIAARKAYTDVKSQSVRSPFVAKATQRNQQIDRYEKIQLDHINLKRQLVGLSPLVKEKRKTNSSRSREGRNSNNRGRSKASRPGNPAAENESMQQKRKLKQEEVAVEVSLEDSLRFIKQIDENRYSLAEYMLFEFTRVDTTLEILTILEASTSDSSMKHQAAYMQYYAIESIRGDEQGGRAALERIKTAYPDYYDTIMNVEVVATEEVDEGEIRYAEIASLFDSGRFIDASVAYEALKMDTLLSASVRGKSCFNHAWLNDHYIFDKEAAIESYNYLVSTFPDEPLATTAQNRLSVLNKNPDQPTEQREDIGEKEEHSDKVQEPMNQRSEKPSGPKEGEKQK